MSGRPTSPMAPSRATCSTSTGRWNLWMPGRWSCSITAGHYEFVASALTRAGFPVIIPDYRLFPDVTFPAFVEDGAAAVTWAVRNADELGISTDAVFLMGHSAGAHIASLVALDQSYLSRHSDPEISIRAWIGLSGPYDFLPIEGGFLLDVFPEPSRDQSQPVNYVTSTAPPALLIHGTGDTTVRIENSKSLASRLHEQGVAARLETYDGVGHVGVMLALAPTLDFLADTLQDSRDYILELLGETVAAGE